MMKFIRELFCNHTWILIGYDFDKVKKESVIEYFCCGCDKKRSIRERIDIEKL